GNIATDHILDFLVTYAPTAAESAPIRLAPAGTTGNGGGANGAAKETLAVSDSGPLALYVFKTISDPFAGHISFFKVFSGVVKNDAAVQNFTRNLSEKFSHLSIMQGKTAVNVGELHAGDIGAVAKLKGTLTGDSLGDKGHPLGFPPVNFAE